MTDGAVVSFPTEAAGTPNGMSQDAARILATVRSEIPPESLPGMNRGVVARHIKTIMEREAESSGIVRNLLRQRDLVTEIVNAIYVEAPAKPRAPCWGSYITRRSTRRAARSRSSRPASGS